MKGIFSITALLVIFLALTAGSQTAWREDEMEVRVYFENREQANRIEQLDVHGDIYLHAGYALLYMTPPELESVRAGGFNYTILKSNLNDFARQFWSDRDQYHSYAEIISLMDSLSENYPSICMKKNYGTSVEGRQLAALKISDNAMADENEPEIMFDGGIHGDEVGGAENLVRFAKFLCESYGADPLITELIDDREIWLYIMVNPDGRVNMVRHNSNGIDLNRDFGFMWNGSGSSPSYYSQPETRALRACMFENQFVIHTCYHSGTVFLAYPWSYRPDPTPDQSVFHYLAGVYVEESGYDYLPYEQGYTGMYPINGSSKDAGYGSLGSVAWTMEISVDKQPPQSEIQYYYDINKPSMIEMIEQAGYGLRGNVTDAGTGDPVAAVIFIDDFYPCYNDPEVGDYHKYLLAGTYSVKAVANGYQTAVQDIEVFSDSVVPLDFALQPASHHHAYRVEACALSYSNFADEAHTFNVIGAPDGISYSLGRSGWIIIDMQSEISDGPGDEIRIHEGDSEPEGYSCYASGSADGPWLLLGGATGTASFDLSVAGLTHARYFRVEDDGDGVSSGDNAGFDLDAMEAIDQPDVIFLLADCFIEDESGNNNSRIDPGETFNLVITLQNLGSMDLENGKAFLNFDSEFLNFTYPELSSISIPAHETLALEFSGSCSIFCPDEEVLMTVLNIWSQLQDYHQSFPLHFASGAIIEDWETGNLLKFEWENTGDKNWAINFQDPYQGSYSAKSGNIDDGEISALQVTLDVIGHDDISFACKVSSEYGSDYLRFYIDNNLMGLWTGEQPWQIQQYQVKPGTHTFKWAFEKDNTGTAGSDGGWIDYIVFPSCNMEGTLKGLANAVPPEICGAGTSHLGAYVLGGSGNYSFSWSPASNLNDSTTQFPVATLSENTTYSVNIVDGQDIVSSAVAISLLELPGTPVIVQAGDSIISSVEAGNRWYDSNGMIEGAFRQVFYPDTEGDYFARTENEGGCLSDSSNIIHFLFTDIPEKENETIIDIYPNPFNEYLQIHLENTDYSELTITLCDILGKQTETHIKSNNGFIILDTREVKNGLFLIIIKNNKGKKLHSSKLLKL